MHELVSTASETPKRFQCRHIFTDGRRCRSACLRHEEFCYYHHNTRKPAQNPRARKGRRSAFDLPLPEDQSAIQTSIGQVLQRIASNDIDPRRAGLLLYGLQIASLNLPKPQQDKDAQPEPAVEEVVTDAELGSLAPQAEMPKTRQVLYAEVEKKWHEVWRLLKDLEEKKKQWEIEQTQFLIERSNFEKALIRARAGGSSSPQPTVIPDVQGAAVADTGKAERTRSSLALRTPLQPCRKRIASVQLGVVMVHPWLIDGESVALRRVPKKAAFSGICP